MEKVTKKPFNFKWYDDFVAASVADDGQLDFTLQGDSNRLSLVLVELMERHTEFAALLLQATNQYLIGLVVNKKQVSIDQLSWTQPKGAKPNRKG